MAEWWSDFGNRTVGNAAGSCVCRIADLVARQGQFRDFEPVVVAFEGEGFGMVDAPVDHG